MNAETIAAVTIAMVGALYLFVVLPLIVRRTRQNQRRKEGHR